MGPTWVIALLAGSAPVQVVAQDEARAPVIAALVARGITVASGDGAGAQVAMIVDLRAERVPSDLLGPNAFRIDVSMSARVERGGKVVAAAAARGRGWGVSETEAREQAIVEAVGVVVGSLGPHLEAETKAAAQAVAPGTGAAATSASGTSDAATPAAPAMRPPVTTAPSSRSLPPEALTLQLTPLSPLAAARGAPAPLGQLTFHNRTAAPAELVDLRIDLPDLGASATVAAPSTVLPGASATLPLAVRVDRAALLRDLTPRPLAVEVRLTHRARGALHTAEARGTTPLGALAPPADDDLAGLVNHANLLVWAGRLAEARATYARALPLATGPDRAQVLFDALVAARLIGDPGAFAAAAADCIHAGGAALVEPLALAPPEQPAAPLLLWWP